jgi:ribonuclease VapC
VIVDASAVIAVVNGEDDAEEYAEILLTASSLNISAATLLEANMVMRRSENPVMHRLVDDLIESLGVAIVPFDGDQARMAIHAFDRYGKGSGHKAKLNFGDCMVFALAKSLDEPLLFKGSDFSKTDLQSAL